MIIFIIIIILLLLLRVFNNNTESFTDSNNNQKLTTKNTNNYNLVYNTPEYSIWEPKNNLEYMPLGQVVTKSKSSPLILSPLIKSSNNTNDRPKDFMLVVNLGDDMKIWAPIPNNGYKSMCHIFSKNKPSIHDYRCVKSDLVIEDNINNMIVKDDKRKMCLWNPQESSNFVASVYTTKNQIDKVYKFKSNIINVENTIDINYTSSFKKIATMENITFWKPVPINNYCAIGYIAYKNDKDPNNVLSCITIHKKFCKPIYSCGKMLNSFLYNEAPYSIWKPSMYEGYGMLSDIVIEGTSEDVIDNNIYSVSLDYLKSVKYNRTMIWNNLPKENIKSIWVDDNMFFHFGKSLSAPFEFDNIINEALININNDEFDPPKNVILKYSINNNNTYDYDNNERNNLIIKSLCSKLDINHKRIKDINVDVPNKKIYFMVDSREKNSNQSLTIEIVELLKNILDNQNIKIYNPTKTNHILEITSMFIQYKKSSNRIKVDNTKAIQSLQSLQ